MAGNNGHSKRPIGKVRKQKPPTGLAKKAVEATAKILFQKKGRNN